MGHPKSSCSRGSRGFQARSVAQIPSLKCETWATLAEGPAVQALYQRNPKVTGIIPTVPVPMLLDELVGEFTQT
jgi:hypothetical protein